LKFGSGESIITPPKEVVVYQKPKLTRSDPFDLFSDAESKFAGSNPLPQKKRPIPIKRPEPFVVSSDADVSEVETVRRPPRLPPVTERRAVTGGNAYSNLSAKEITALAKKQGIPTTKKGSKGQDVRIPKKDLIPLLM
jgi:hypothetical protein